MQRRRLETAALAAAFTLVKALFGYAGMAAGASALTGRGGLSLAGTKPAARGIGARFQR